MTAARRNGTRLGALAALACALALAFAVPARLGAQTTERIVIDRHTGLAIHGIDPVGYFTDARPMPGQAELEYPFAGAIWRFRNEGNRAAFAQAPEVYMPRFGGYDPLAVARGLANPGHPQLWLIVKARLYLFHDPDSRNAFLAEARETIAAAEAKWPAVERELVN